MATPGGVQLVFEMQDGTVKRDERAAACERASSTNNVLNWLFGKVSPAPWCFQETEPKVPPVSFGPGLSWGKVAAVSPAKQSGREGAPSLGYALPSSLYSIWVLHSDHLKVEDSQGLVQSERVK